MSDVRPSKASMVFAPPAAGLPYASLSFLGEDDAETVELEVGTAVFTYFSCDLPAASLLTAAAFTSRDLLLPLPIAKLLRSRNARVPLQTPRVRAVDYGTARVLPW